MLEAHLQWLHLRADVGQDPAVRAAPALPVDKYLLCCLLNHQVWYTLLMGIKTGNVTNELENLVTPYG